MEKSTRSFGTAGKIFLDRKTYIGNIGLYTGDSGVLLLLTQYYLWSGDERYVNKAYEVLTKIEEMISGKNVLSTFCSGLAGYGWLLCYLNEKEVLDIDEDYFAELDTLLELWINKMQARREYDLMHGLLGLGLYFLKRQKVDPVRNILNTLAQDAEYDDNGEIRWFSYSQYRPKRYDFGLAHGMAGFLYFLNKCYALGIEQELCYQLGNGIVQFYLHNEMDASTVGSYYPYSILYDDYNQHAYTPTKCRLAWCYGDVSSLSVIYQYAKLVGDKRLERTTVDKLVSTSYRRDLKDVEIKDAQFCHGASGLAHMYNRLYRQTGRCEFKSAAVYWMKVMVTIGLTTNNESGYVFTENNVTNGTMAACYSLLEGSAGLVWFYCPPWMIDIWIGMRL